MFRLSINSGFAVNRYIEPFEWLKVIRLAGCNYAQMTADLINPYLPDKVIDSLIKQINEAKEEFRIQISSTFTGAYTRLNHLAHPDKEIQKYWIEWFKEFCDISIAVGSDNMGSHFGILSAKDNSDKKLRKERCAQNIENWHEIAGYAKKAGMNYISWEPMSISREQGHTQEEAKKLQQKVNKNSPLPFKICLDVDHGDISSKNPLDYNPYSWLENFAKDSPLIHLKQSQTDKNGHYPFLDKYNKTGKIKPQKVINALEKGGRYDADFILELSFREREPDDSNVIKVLKSSVDYWRKFIKD